MAAATMIVPIAKTSAVDSRKPKMAPLLYVLATCRKSPRMGVGGTTCWPGACADGLLRP